jgi:sensor domain CHASE-containing protein
VILAACVLLLFAAVMAFLSRAHRADVSAVDDSLAVVDASLDVRRGQERMAA